MTNDEEITAASFGAGALPLSCDSGSAGLSVGICAAVKYVQPALQGEGGISKVGADWITAGISLLGGLELTATAGFFWRWYFCWCSTLLLPAC
jgi:hypothetical protein